MSSLIPEYRSTLARMKKQVDELQLRLENACQERHSLHQQVGPLLIFVCGFQSNLSDVVSRQRLFCPLCIYLQGYAAVVAWITCVVSVARLLH